MLTGHRRLSSCQFVRVNDRLMRSINVLEVLTAPGLGTYVMVQRSVGAQLYDPCEFSHQFVRVTFASIRRIVTRSVETDQHFLANHLSCHQRSWSQPPQATLGGITYPRTTPVPTFVKLMAGSRYSKLATKEAGTSSAEDCPPSRSSLCDHQLELSSVRNKDKEEPASLRIHIPRDVYPHVTEPEQSTSIARHSMSSRTVSWSHHVLDPNAFPILSFVQLQQVCLSCTGSKRYGTGEGQWPAVSLTLYPHLFCI